jgi:hypothetical protein
MSNPKTIEMINELRDDMLISPKMEDATPEEFVDAVKLAMKESFSIAVRLQKFLRDHSKV